MAGPMAPDDVLHTFSPMHHVALPIPIARDARGEIALANGYAEVAPLTVDER
jgi:hypothetical protein